MSDWNGEVQDALNRLRRASDRGTGCYLTPAMMKGLATTFIGQIWSEEDPRKAAEVIRARGQKS